MVDATFALLPKPTLPRGLSCISFMATRAYIAYLDEFGHVGPFIGREHPKHCTSPVFGLAGYLLPLDRVRWFATWFFKRKCELLEFEIRRSGKPAALWEKKGSSLYTVQNVERYRALRHFTHRMLRQLRNLGGFVFYVGMEKDAAPHQHNPKGLYAAVFGEAIKRLDDFCDDAGSASFLLALDQHEAMRPILITHAARAMFGGESPKRHLIEPPIHLESDRYQTIQAADWIAGLVGRLGAFRADPDSYPENASFEQYFGSGLREATRRSSIKRKRRTRFGHV